MWPYFIGLSKIETADPAQPRNCQQSPDLSHERAGSRHRTTWSANAYSL